MHRRAFLASSALAFLTGCAASTTSANSVPVTAAADLKLIADACLPLTAAIASMASVPPALVTQINSDVAQLEAAAAAVQPGIAVVVAAPRVSTVASAISSIVTALSVVSLPANVTQILTAVQTLLPLVEAAVGIAVALASRTNVMTPEQARTVLTAGLL